MAHVAKSQQLKAQSTVAVSPKTVTTSYTAIIGRRQTVIASCRAALSDVESATAVRTRGQVYFLIQLKPQRAARCDSGNQSVAALPADDFQAASRVAAAVNRACCSTAGRAPAPTSKKRVVAGTVPSPSSPPVAKVRPSPATRVAVVTPTPLVRAVGPGSPTTSSASSLVDWVETEGLFQFVRVRNVGNDDTTITSGDVVGCKTVDVGCGKVAGPRTLHPSDTVTIATIASTDQQNVPSFTYRYSASVAGANVSGRGSSTKLRPERLPPMSPQEIRAAEAAALGGLRGLSRTQTQQLAQSEPPLPSYVGARLLKRGTSRLAIGEKGVARVRVLVAPNGTPEEASIVSISNRLLSAAAIETAVSSTFSPAMRDGKAVASNYVATFTFNGEDPETSGIPVWRRTPLSTPSPTPLPTASPLPLFATPPPAPAGPPPPL